MTTIPRIEALTVESLDELERLEGRAQARPWTRTALAEELTAAADRAVLGAYVDDALVGYIALRELAGELWIMNLAVEPARRRTGIGRALVDGAKARAARTALELWLEVRAGNDKARALYERTGFVVVGQRPRYYPPESGQGRYEDAVLMRAEG